MVKYTITIFTPQELNQSSFIQTGLFELEQIGFINVKVKIDTKKYLGRYSITNDKLEIKEKQAYPKVSRYELKDNSTGKKIYFATDLYDFSSEFSYAAYNDCDYVFKRNYESKYVNLLPLELQKKTIPLGLSFSVHSSHKRAGYKFFLGLFLSNINVNNKFNRSFFKRLKHTLITQFNHYNLIKKTRKLERFNDFSIASKETIMFQTRCFLREDQPDVIAIHKQRYNLIKLLRKHFPNNFLGGFVKSKMVEQNYADAISNVPSNPEEYLDALKESKIVIYTRGLANSPAWKMAEYMSQGKVIIAEELTAELPVKIKDGKELLFFKNDDELISNINKVLSNKELASFLSKNAREYFEKNIHPRESVKRILDIMIKDLNG